jgi:hypothetical protein
MYSLCVVCPYCSYSFVCFFLVWRLICVLCLIVVPLPPGKNPFAVKINNNIKKYFKISQLNQN